MPEWTCQNVCKVTFSIAILLVCVSILSKNMHFPVDRVPVRLPGSYFPRNVHRGHQGHSCVFAIVSKKGNHYRGDKPKRWYQWEQSCRHCDPPKLGCDLRGNLALRLPSPHPSGRPSLCVCGGGATAEAFFCDYFLSYVLSSRSINFRINLWLFRWTSKFAYKWFAPLKTSTRGHIKPKLI